MENFDLKKYLAEGRLLKDPTNLILESIFDKVTTMVKGKSDKEAAAIDAFKKNEIEVGKPFYQFKYGGGSGKDGENSFWMENTATPEELENLQVPVPVGFTGDRISRDVLVKVTLKKLKEDKEGVVKVTMVASNYNFKTGKFINSDQFINVIGFNSYTRSNTFDVEDVDSIEKELEGKEYENEIYSEIEMVPFAGSPWVK
tara:strand:+ start:61 stop:660 length:600 start_codon:yes stop_codon:yes gene_type:complete